VKTWMESQKKIGTILLLLGIIIFILALSADFIGLERNLPNISEYWYPGYGYKQISGFIVGTILIVVGLYLKQLAFLLLKVQKLEDKIDELKSKISQ